MVDRCSQETVDAVKIAVIKSISLVEKYRWMIDAYVSDFFTNKYWRKLDTSWRESLEDMDIQGLSYLLADEDQDKQESTTRCVLPLSLLAFKKYTQSLSLKRKMVDINNTESMRHIYPGSETWQTCDSTDRPMISIIDPKVQVKEKTDLSEVSSKGKVKDGQFLPLNQYLRRHVKPKKQHEILQLGQTISLLGSSCSCGNVVDVGAGQGHLSRLLTFGYGFKVTTVEAVGCHASRARKFDRNTQELINKRTLKRKHDFQSEMTTTESTKVISDDALPDHVTCVIQPDTSMDNFLQIVQQTFNKNLLDQDCGDGEEKNYHLEQSAINCKLIDIEVIGDKRCKQTCEELSDNPCRGTKTKEELSDKECEKTKEELSDKVWKETKEELSDKQCKETKKDLSDRQCKETKEELSDKQRKETKEELSDKHYNETKEVVSDKQFIKTKGYVNDLQWKETKEQLSDKEGHKTKEEVSDKVSKSTITEEHEQMTDENLKFGRISLKQSDNVQERNDKEFLLTGLHACGDLTSTMLRVFAQCPDICGLASVGCCYMKLSCDSGSSNTLTSDPGYPMSQFVRSLSHHHLSYEAREMACHFADSYAQRLKDNPPALKLHCYRAALQCIIKHKSPDFNHGCIKLNVKRAEDLTFEQYAKKSLKRLGLDDSIPEEVLEEVQNYLPLWKNVVAFYTLRLSLAPVVESLILMDRMLYLYEQGTSSTLVPVFDPAWSPRNFVLLAKKTT